MIHLQGYELQISSTHDDNIIIIKISSPRNFGVILQNACVSLKSPTTVQV